MKETFLIILLLSAVFAFVKFPPGYSSFDDHHNDQPVMTSPANYMALCMFCGLAFFTNLGVYPITFTLLSEVFPFKYGWLKLNICIYKKSE